MIDKTTIDFVEKYDFLSSERDNEDNKKIAELMEPLEPSYLISSNENFFDAAKLNKFPLNAWLILVRFASINSGDAKEQLNTWVCASILFTSFILDSDWTIQK